MKRHGLSLGADSLSHFGGTPIIGGMTYEDLIVLIPSHSLEDFPAELGEPEAASLLNAFAVAWHPALLATAKVLPRWHRADDPPDSTQKRLIFLPTHCESWVPSGWAERVAAEGCTVIRGLSDRQEMIAAVLAPLGTASGAETSAGEAHGGAAGPACDGELVGDFLALGFCFLQVELLTRKMRHFSNLDEVHLQREAVAAAEAALAGDGETARTRLKACFEVLQESRERFYPVDCYLLDLCLLIPRLADAHFLRMLRTLKPVSVLASARDLSEIAQSAPDALAALKESWQRGTADVVCGDLSELPLPLLPLNSVIWQLGEAQEIVERLIGKRPGVWGRRRYGVFPQLPQLLKKSGFQGALHTVLDDGIYPDAEHSKFRWEGTDGTSIEALSRIPLAAEAAPSFLRFPDRMSESMDNDHVAAVIFARWPESQCPFYEDLERMSRYAPVLGRFVTLGDFFTQTESPTRHARHKPNEYLTPYLFQAGAREEQDPVSRYADRLARRQRFDSAAWLHSVEALLGNRTPDGAALDLIERTLEQLAEPAEPAAAAEMDERLAALVAESAGGLAERIMAGSGDRRGWLVFNTLGFRRLVTVELDRQGPAPAGAGPNSWVQWDEARGALTLEVPGAGFVWVAAGDAPPAWQPGPSAPALAETNLLRNEFFEVHINEATGGIAKLKGYGRSPNRLSQQVNYRFARERTIVSATDQAEVVKSHYAEMRRTGAAVTCAGPALGEIRSTGEIVDQQNGNRLAGFTQTVRVWRGRPVVELDIELDIDQPPDGEAWHNYFAARFAWHDETASLTRSVMLGAHETSDERIESLHAIELATPEERTTLVTPGLPFHRKTGPRMIDTILVPALESRRRFRFVIAVDQPFLMQAALDAQAPAIVVPTRGGPPRAGTTGWFFHLNARNVQMLGLFPLKAEPRLAEAAWQPVETPPAPTGCGCAVRLVETEGRPVRASLRCFRTPRGARQRDFHGHTLNALAIDGDAVSIDLAAYEITDVEIRFD